MEARLYRMSPVYGLALALLSTLNPQLSTFAQGSLTPPGAPAPTMRSLSQIEPRTPIVSLPYSITTAGAYYLITNLTGVSGSNGITIAANDVTLDLNGYSLAGVAGSIEGIVVSGNRTNLSIGNGTIRDWGLDGVDALNSRSSVFIGLHILRNGNTGLRPGYDAAVSQCILTANAQEGILAFDGCRITRCDARTNGATGINAGNNSQVSDCAADLNLGDGIDTGSGSQVSRCNVRGNNAAGISVGSGVRIADCVTGANAGNGISAGSGASISGCSAQANRGRGIDTGAASSLVQCAVVGIGDYVSSGHSGISVGDGSVVKDCSSRNHLGSGDTSGIIIGSNCAVNDCAFSSNYTGIYMNGTGSNCVVVGGCVSGNTFRGVYVGWGSTIRACTVSGNGAEGIYLYNGLATVEGCTVVKNRNSGIYIQGGGCLILNNTCDSNGAGTEPGIACESSQNRIEGNHLNFNSNRGLFVAGGISHNVIVRNSAVTNSIQTIGYLVDTNANDVGPIGKAATATSPWANLQ